MVLDTQQRISTILYASTVSDPSRTSTVQEFLISYSRNHYGTYYLTMDQHNRPCFHGIGPFPHFHGVGTSPRFHDIRIVIVLDTQQWINTIFFASTMQDPFCTSTVQELLLHFTKQNHYATRYPTKDKRNLLFPRCRSLSTLPCCRNFYPLPRRRIHYGARYPTTDKHNIFCFHGVGPFPNFHGVGIIMRIHGVGIIMVLDTQQRINKIFYTSMVYDPLHTSTMQELLHASTAEESLWCSIPYNGLQPSSTLPHYRTRSTLPQCRNFSSLVPGIIMVVDI